MPWPWRPVRPMRCVFRPGEAEVSKHTISETSGMSRPSSATHVATSTLNLPSRKFFSTSFCCFWLMPLRASAAGAPWLSERPLDPP